MLINHQLVLLALSVILLILKSDNQILCSRTSTNPRPKLKCLRNVTTVANIDSQALTIHGNAKCVTLSQPYCLDIKLPYNSIALLDTFPDLNLKSFEDVQLFLEKWRGAQKLPGCWPTLQMALCSLLMPRCEEDPLTGRAVQFHQSNVDICLDLTNANKTNCKLIQKLLPDEWVTLFTCNDTNLYAKNCTNEVRELRHSISANTKTVCQYPLVPTSDNQNWFRDIEGCSLTCKFPISNPHDQANINLMLKVLCFIGLISTIWAILLFEVNKAGSRSSRIAKVIKRCTICQLLIYIGWSLQFILNHDVGCKSDGSPLFGQPLVANSCILSFILTYLPSLSSLFWCAHLGKLCHAKLIGKQSQSSGNADLDRTLSLFNYGIPVTLFVSVAFLGHIDGNGLYGICTVGQQSPVIKIIFVFVPSIVGAIYGNYFFVRIIFTLAFVRKEPMKPSLRRNFFRILALSLFITLQSIFPIVNYYYEARNQQEWTQSLAHYVTCQLNPINYDGTLSQHELARQQQECTINSTPFTSLYYLEILSTLIVGLIISSWAFHESNYRGLKRELINALADEKERQRLAKIYFCHEQSGAGDRQRMLAGGPGRGSEMTYHDIIDMASPTRCVDGEKVPDDVEMATNINDNEADEQQNDVVARYKPSQRGISSRCTSVSSVTIAGFCTNFSESSISSAMLQFAPPKKSNRHRKGQSSRDILNDIRQKQKNNLDGQTVNEPSQNPEIPQVLIDEMYRLFQQLNTSELDRVQSDLDDQPRLDHGIEIDPSVARNLTTDTTKETSIG